jgi:hypothetical protein
MVPECHVAEYKGSCWLLAMIDPIYWKLNVWHSGEFIQQDIGLTRQVSQEKQIRAERQLVSLF